MDLAKFDNLVPRGRALLAAGRVAEAATTLTAALHPWRGKPFGEFSDTAIVRPAVKRCNALRHNATEARFDALLQSGRAPEVIGEIEGAIAGYPLQERTGKSIFGAPPCPGFTCVSVIPADLM